VTDPGFPAVIAEFLRAEQVSGPMLALEVSEQTRTSAVSSSFFAQLAELGVRVALDDFGTGFASLESLGGWPVNELKLDMSLVRPIASNASFRTIVRTTVDLAHQLGVKVVGEGVESEAVRSELRALGCDLGQGFLLGRPMAPAAGRRPGHHRGLRALAGLSLGPPASGPDRGPGVLPAERSRRILRLAGIAPHRPRPGHRPGLAAAFGRDLALLARRRDPAFLRGGLAPAAGSDLADAAYLAFYPVACAGLFAFPSRRRTRPERLRSLLDVGTVFIAGATLLWYVALGPAVASKAACCSARSC
jgi:hypothetical protein